MEIIIQAAVMAIIIAVGIVCYKTKIIGDNASKSLSDLTLKVATPALLIMSFQKELSSDRIEGLLQSLVLALVATIIAVIVGYLAVRSKNHDKCVIERFSAIYSNCAFMGIPLINGIYGTEGVFYLTAFYAVFNILVWTHGVILMKGEKGIKSVLNALKSPALIAVFVGLILFLCQITLPDIVGEALDYIGSLTTPLGMIVAGITIAKVRLKDAVRKPMIYYVSFLRLIAIPLVTMLVFMLFPFGEMIKGVNLAAAACPTATICTMFAISYNKDSVYASELFAFSTILSMVTLPVIMQIFNITAAV